MQKILNSGNLLDANGALTEYGYSTFMAKKYSRNEIKASKWRIKEWDYYIVTDGEMSFAFTIADIGYISLISASMIDCVTKKYKTSTVLGVFPFGKFNFPSTIESGDVEFHNDRVMMKFTNDGSIRRILCNFKKFDGDKTLEAEFTISKFPKDSMVIATPFKNAPTAFYYNAKTNCMPTSGYAKVGDDLFLFDSDKSLTTLDWGRGVWTYKNTWFWASLQTYVDGKTFGFNLGYGFGVTTSATENMVFVDGVAHKLDEVTFEIPMQGKKFDYLAPWKITSNDNRINMTFQPILNRADLTNVGVIVSDQNQVFGKFSGSVVLDDYSVVNFKDKIGFAERVYNKW